MTSKEKMMKRLGLSADDFEPKGNEKLQKLIEENKKLEAENVKLKEAKQKLDDIESVLAPSTISNAIKKAQAKK